MNITSKVLVASAFALFSLASAQADPFTATIYEKGSARSKVLFTVVATDKVDGAKRVTSVVFKDPAGKEVVREESIFEGGKAMKYSVQKLQTDESGSITVDGGKANFSWTKEGKTKTDDEKTKDNFVMSPTLVPYLKAHWDEIKAGKDVETRYAAIDRCETVGFKFFKIGEVKVDGKDALEVKMKPSSFVIAALVDPLIFTMDKESGRLLSIVGRVLPRRQDGAKWKDLDAEVVYKY